MASAEKKVIDLATVAKVQADPSTAPSALPTKPVFRFVKTMSPMQVIKTRSGKEVTFYVAQSRRGGYASGGTFETEDAKLAQELREEAKANPCLYIFEDKR